MSQPSDADPPRDARPRFSAPALDLVTIAAVVGAVAATYALWWSRDRLLGLDPTKRQVVASDQDAIILAALFLLLGFSIALLVKRIAGVAGDLPLVLIVFLPMVVFLLLSGKITNLNASPTGFQFTLAEATLQPVSNQDIGRGQAMFSTPPAEEPWCQPEEFTSQAPQQALVAAAQTPTPTVRGNPVFMTIRMGTCNYTMQAIHDVIEKNRYNDEFRFVVLVDSDGVFQGYMDSLTAQELFSCKEYEYLGGPCLDWTYGYDIENAINAFPRTPFAIRGFPGIVFDTVSENSSNIAALKEMRARGLDALVVKDKTGRVKGVLKQDQIVATMMIELASPPPSP